MYQIMFLLSFNTFQTPIVERVNRDVLVELKMLLGVVLGVEVVTGSGIDCITRCGIETVLDPVLKMLLDLKLKVLWY